jgi:hypothetical protein
MAVGLIARASGAALPRRLVYVVDRRAVVRERVKQEAQIAQMVRPDLSQVTRTLTPRAVCVQERHLFAACPLDHLGDR